MDISPHKITERQRHKPEGKPVQISIQEPVPEVTTGSFERLIQNSPLHVLVDFETAWSKRMVPLLDQLAETFVGRLRVVQVDILANPILAARFKIRVVPTMLIFQQGVPVEFIVGTVPARFVFQTVCNTLGLHDGVAQSFFGLETRPWTGARRVGSKLSFHLSPGPRSGQRPRVGTFRSKRYLMKHREQTNPSW